MSNENKLPKFDNLLSSTNYDPAEIEKYFASLAKELKEELEKTETELDAELTSSYEALENEVSKYSTVKDDVLKNYCNECRELQENYQKELSKLENEYISKKSSLLDKLNLEESIKSDINAQYLIKIHNATKPLKEKIEKVTLRIDQEYERHGNYIFEGKDKIYSNTLFYENAESHLKEIDKSIAFLNELKEYNEKIVEENNVSIKKDTDIINIYINYIDEEKEKINSTSSLINNYEIIDANINEITSTIEERIKDLDNDSIKNKEIISKELKDNSSDSSEINQYFENEISSIDGSTKDGKKQIKSINKKKEVLNEYFNAIKQKMILESTVNSNLLLKEKENLTSFKDAINKFNGELKDSYSNEIDSNINALNQTFDCIKNFLNDLLSNLETFKSKASDAVNVIHYFRKRYETVDIEKRIEALEAYKNYLNSNVKENKRLDDLAFELLATEEVLTMKLLELKKEYLTIDDIVRIKELEYDLNIEREAELEVPALAILDIKSEISLLDKDFEIDKEIKANELKNAEYVLELKKKIDMLHIDYMNAYARLENVKKIVAINSEKTTKLENLKSDIALNKMIELALLDSISKKNEYENLVSSYDSEIQKLDETHQQDIRNQNNILEVERNNFEAKRQEILDEAKALEKEEYPEINKQKAEAGKKIKSLKGKFDDIKKNEEKAQNDLKEALDNAKSNYESNSNDFSEILSSSLPIKLGDIYKRVQDSENIVTDLVAKVKDLYSKTNNDLSKIDSEKVHEIEFDESLAKKAEEINNSLKNCKDEKEYKTVYKQANGLVQNLLKTLDKEFKGITGKIEPTPKKKLDKRLSEYDDAMKNLVAQEAIKNTENIMPNLDRIDEINKEKEAKQQDLEKKIADYKNFYKDAIKAIEDDYNQKLNQINELKDARLADNNMLSSNIDKIVSDALAKTNSEKQKTKDANDLINTELTSKADNTINSLSDDMKNKNDDYSNVQNERQTMNENFRKEMETKAKEIYKYMEELKAKNAQEIAESRKDLIENKDAYNRSLEFNSLEFKEAYKKKSEYLEEEYLNRKADKAIEYAELFQKLKENSLNAHSEVALPINSFKEIIEGLNNEVTSQVEKVSAELINDSSSSIDKINADLQNIIESLNGKEE